MAVLLSITQASNETSPEKFRYFSGEDGGQPGRAVVGNNLITWLDASGNPTTASALQADGLIVGTVFA